MMLRHAAGKLGLVCLLFGHLGCSDRDDGPSSIDSSRLAQNCLDEDGDGYVLNCSGLLDCDDGDATVTDECYRCATPQAGCECETEGQRIDCGETESTSGGETLCGAGERLCDGGVWGECVLNNSVYKLPADHPNYQIASSSPMACVDACDPYCTHWNDLPSDDDIADSGTGIVADANGVSLAAGTTVSAVSACSGGTSDSCAHHLCDDGIALDEGCDVATACIAEGSACDDSTPCCFGLACEGGTCVSPSTARASLFFEDFDSGNTQGWSLDGEWEMGSASSSSGQHIGNADAGADTTDGSSNGVAGADIGGNVDVSVHDFYYLTSPAIDTSGAGGTLTLSFQRWLNSDYEPYMDNTVQVYAGGTWTEIWGTGYSTTADAAWQLMTFDLSDYKDAAMQIRFGYSIGDSWAYSVSGWNIDDVRLEADAPAAQCSAMGGACDDATPCCDGAQCLAGVCAPADSCVTQVCDVRPSCCTDTWDTTCVELVDTECSLSCGIDTDNTCVACYEDDLDHDGDGFSFNEGDCRDCDPNINPGAIDFPDNGIDEDCGGVVDEPTGDCDSAMTFASSDPMAYAEAMDLCSTTSDVDNHWGVISAELVQADGVTPCSDSLQRAIMSRFGDNNVPLAGQSMAVLSSGTARDSSDPGYIAPSGQVGSYSNGSYSTAPDGFPQNASGCPVGTAAYDSCSLKLTIRAPTNAQSFAYSFNFFTSEYPEWTCNYYNDTFIALYDGSLNTTSDGNISFDENDDPVSVNAGFFGVPGDATLTTHDVLDGTGFDGYCDNTQYDSSNVDGACGGATDWLTTTAPVEGGEEFELFLSIWDTGDTFWDSTVLLDNFQWSAQPATISTLPASETVPDLYSEGEFLRVYDYEDACPDNYTASTWGSWSWTAKTPDDSSVEFYIRTAETEAGLASATEVPLTFTDPPGPAGLVGANAVAEAAPTDTQSGSVDVAQSLLNAGVQAERFIQIRSVLKPSTDQLSAPILEVWDQEASCLPQD